MKHVNRTITVLVFIFLYIPMIALAVASFNEGLDIATFKGFTFRQYNHIDMLGAVDRAIEAYRQPDIWKGLMKNAMSAHFTWEKSAGKYIELYERLSER